jgi:Lsr2
MAKQTVTQLTDDLDGDEAVEELTFALRGVQYEIDLNAKNVAALEKALDKYITAGHRVVHHRAPRGSIKRSNGSGPGETALIREWALASGYDVSSRGRISAEVRAAYDAAP